MIQYKPSPFAFNTEGPSLTEPEHQQSCDINVMIKNAHKGINVRGGKPPQYGYDDTTMDGLQFRIQKEELESNLAKGPKEFEKSVFDKIPDAIKQKFGYKIKEPLKTPQNDDKTTNPQNPTPPINPPKKTEPPQS